jgi:hypothetical protein
MNAEVINTGTSGKRGIRWGLISILALVYGVAVFMAGFGWGHWKYTRNFLPTCVSKDDPRDCVVRSSQSDYEEMFIGQLQLHSERYKDRLAGLELARREGAGEYNPKAIDPKDRN